MTQQEQHAFYTMIVNEQVTNLYLYHRNRVIAVYRVVTGESNAYMPFSEYEKFLKAQDRELMEGEIALIKRIWKFLHLNNVINPALESEEAFEAVSPRAAEAEFPDPLDPALQIVPQPNDPIKYLHLLATINSNAKPSQNGARQGNSVALDSLASLASSSSSIQASATSGDYALKLANSAPGVPSKALATPNQSSRQNPSRSTGYSALDALAAAFELPSTPIASRTAAPMLSPFSSLVATASSLLPSSPPSSLPSSAEGKGKRNWTSANSQDLLENGSDEELAKQSNQSQYSKKSAVRNKHPSQPAPRPRTLRSDPSSSAKLVAPLEYKSGGYVDPILLTEAEAIELQANALTKLKKLAAPVKRPQKQAPAAVAAPKAKKSVAAPLAPVAAMDVSQETRADKGRKTLEALQELDRRALARDTDPGLVELYSVHSSGNSSRTQSASGKDHMPSTRDFVYHPAGTLVVKPMPVSNAAKEPSPDVRVCIIGAGIAGLAAAQCLIQHGIKNVTIFESRSRAGGRIHSTLVNETIVELGAQFTPHHRTNPILEIASKIELEHRGYGGYRPHASLQKSAANYKGAKHTSSSSGVTNEPAVPEPSESSSSDKASSLMNGIEPTDPNKAEESKAPRPSSDVSKTPFLRSGLFQFGAHPYQLTSEASPARSYSSSGVDSVVMLERGLKEFVANLTIGLRLHLSCAVHSITFTSPYHEDPFFVHYRDSTGELQKGSFDVVLVTVPLGILKHGDIRFVPALPPAKRDCIAKLAVGHQNKATMVFNIEFWERRPDCIVYRDDTLGIIVSCADSTPETPMLQLFWCGDAAKAMNQLEPNEYLRTLAAKIPNVTEATPALRAFQWAPWSHDAHCYGAHSYVPAGESHTLREVMAEPLYHGHLGFAGEHTAILRPSSAHGAYESGIREAKRIIVSKAGLEFGKIRS